MENQTILVIRHAEKPTATEGGVDEAGRPDDHDLSVRGWQRAGALTQYFSTGRPRHPGIGRITHLFAPKPDAAHPSRRGASTLAPLGRLLGLPVATPYAVGEETALAQHVKSLAGTLLIAWEHKRIPLLGNHLAYAGPQPPATWPDDRFDALWLFVRDPATGGGRYAAVAQRLMAGDAATLWA